jgi:hypothetical protein
MRRRPRRHEHRQRPLPGRRGTARLENDFKTALLSRQFLIWTIAPQGRIRSTDRCPISAPTRSDQTRSRARFLPNNPRLRRFTPGNATEAGSGISQNIRNKRDCINNGAAIGECPRTLLASCTVPLSTTKGPGTGSRTAPPSTSDTKSIVPPLEPKLKVSTSLMGPSTDSRTCKETGLPEVLKVLRAAEKVTRQLSTGPAHRTASERALSATPHPANARYRRFPAFESWAVILYEPRDRRPRGRRRHWLAR